MATAAALVGPLVLLAGCAPPEPGGGQPGTPTGSGRAGGAGSATELPVNQSFWYAGFKVTLGTARVVGAEVDAPLVVTIDATFQNLSTEYENEPTDALLLTSGDHLYTEPARDHQDLPEVPAQLSQPGTIAFEVDDQFVLAEAVLTAGTADTRQAVVPLGRSEGLVALEPRTVQASGRVGQSPDSPFFMTVESGEVRADYPRTHQQAPTGQEYVRLSFSATNDSAAGMAYVFDRDLTLLLPDGTTVGHDLFCSYAQVHAEPHSTVSGGVACFLVPVPAVGEYTLIWMDHAEGGLRFTIG